MKKLVMTMAAVVLMGSVAVAQESEKKGKRPERKFDKTEIVKHRTDEVVKKYGLSEKQAAQLLELNTQYAEKMGPGPRRGHHHGGRPGMGHPDHHGKDSLKARPVPPRTDGTTQATPQATPQHKEREAAMKAYEAELQKIMTAEQYEQYKSDRRHDRHQKPRRQNQQ